ncbi:uncharacterized protein LOC118193575 [Stegodyphus dumicola]|uniref:uncharacterized protein LOC118193575 n=1 Tax=Stegodyphus dumicola TaxID=202533 RepID=UPI0015B1F594|nr:uncharacterized protein LOC118193575 [Stegodyphus dumicola]
MLQAELAFTSVLQKCTKKNILRSKRPNYQPCWNTDLEEQREIREQARKEVERVAEKTNKKCKQGVIKCFPQSRKVLYYHVYLFFFFFFYLYIFFQFLSCSVECYKSHKGSEQCVKKEDKSESVVKNGEVQNYEFETEDTVKPEKLNLLAFHKGVRHSLENRHLRDMLEYLDSAQDPAQAIEEAMKEPIFLEFVNHCLHVVEDD